MGLRPFMILAILVGCGSESADFGEESASRAASPEMDASDTGRWLDEEDGAGSSDSVAVAHWDLAGSLKVVDGEIEADKSMFVARLLGEQQEVVCQGFIALDSASIAPIPEEGILGWWTVRIQEPAEGNCLDGRYPGAKEFQLGIGAMHPEIRAVIGADEVLGALNTEQLNAMYISLDEEETIWVFGAAGILEAFSGDADAATTQGDLDGSWQFEPVYSFPI